MIDVDAFLTATAALVDGLLAQLQPRDRHAVDLAIAAGATLRLAVNLAPRREVTLYLVVGVPPRPVTVATWPAPDEPSTSPPAGLVQ